MGNVNFTVSNAGKFPSSASNVKTPVLVEHIIDLSTKTIAASDVLQSISLPAESVVLAAGAEVKSVMTGTSTDATATVKVGSTAFSAALDFDGAAAGAYTVAAALTPVVSTAASTVDVVLSAFTGTITGGKLRVYALVLDVSDAKKPGIAQLKS